MERATTKSRTTVVFLAVLTAIAIYFCFVLARAFLTSIAWALVIAVLFFPLHNRIHKSLRNRNAAALISIILVILMFMVPAVLLGKALVGELGTLYRQANKNSLSGGGWPAEAARLSNDISAWVAHFTGSQDFDFRAAAVSRIEQASEMLGSVIAGWLGNVASLLAGFVITLFVLFFVFRDGLEFRDRMGAVLPLSQEQVQKLFLTISESIVAEMYGVVAVALGQGLLMGLCFWAMGLPSPVLWGALTAIVSLVPVGGTALVWIPGAIFLFATGHWVRALILLAWGGGVVSTGASIVQPIVIGRRVKLHPLEIFLGLLGGIQAFGLIGIFAGPIIISLTLALVRILRDEVRRWRSANSESSPAGTQDTATVVIEAITSQ